MTIAWDEIAADISRARGRAFAIAQCRNVGGGCINAGYRLDGADAVYFVKINDVALADMFAAEAAGLEEMAATATVRVPRSVCTGTAGGASYLVLEYIDLAGSSPAAAALLGRQLAEMHRQARPYYGWHRDNTIGSTPQINAPADDWSAFWRDRRLGFQLGLAARRGFGGRLQRQGERLLARLGDFFRGHVPQASLLHGDLWGGNYAVASGGSPVVFDPAVYYGDREADIAMTELFGGFSRDFYAAYREAWPLDAGYALRKQLYNLYHVLNHGNLFGGGYIAQAEHMMDRLLAEIG